MPKRFHRFGLCLEPATPAATRRSPAAMSWKWIRGRALLPSHRSCALYLRWVETNPVLVGPAASTSTVTAPFSKRAVESGEPVEPGYSEPVDPRRCRCGDRRQGLCVDRPAVGGHAHRG